MSYRGATSTNPNPPVCIFGPNIWGKRSSDAVGSSQIVGFGIWRYNTTDGTTELISNTYFTDGFYLGMKEGDLVFGSVDTGSSISLYWGVVGPVTTDGCGIASSGGYLSSTR